MVAFEGVLSALGITLPSVGCDGNDEFRSGDFCGAGSLSRTCRITSDSRFDSLSRGEDSSISAARIRAKVFVFGYTKQISGYSETQRTANLPVNFLVV